MAAINALITRDEVVNQLVKRKNFAAREPGVMVVFCIAGVVALGIAGFWINKAIQKRKLAKASVV